MSLTTEQMRRISTMGKVQIEKLASRKGAKRIADSLGNLVDAIQRVAEAARELSDNAEPIAKGGTRGSDGSDRDRWGFHVSAEDMDELRTMLRAWTESRMQDG